MSHINHTLTAASQYNSANCNNRSKRNMLSASAITVAFAAIMIISFMFGGFPLLSKWNLTLCLYGLFITFVASYKFISLKHQQHINHQNTDNVHKHFMALIVISTIAINALKVIASMCLSGYSIVAISAIIISTAHAALTCLYFVIFLLRHLPLNKISKKLSDELSLYKSLTNRHSVDSSFANPSGNTSGNTNSFYSNPT